MKQMRDNLLSGKSEAWAINAMLIPDNYPLNLKSIHAWGYQRHDDL